MAEGDAAADKTEAATPRRHQQAREEGNVPISRELTSFIVLGTATLALVTMAPDGLLYLTRHLAQMVAHSSRTDLPGGVGAALRESAMAFLVAVLPVISVILVMVVLTVMLQSGFATRSNPVSLDWARVSPLAGLKRLFNADSLAEAVKSVAKTAVIGVVIWRVLAGQAGQFRGAMAWDTRMMIHRTERNLLQMLGAILAVQAVLAVGDLLWVRYRHGQQLRMTKDDVRQEQKDTDGNPLIKARLRQIREQRARKRMMAAVPKATVVVTNPTHYAVALAYDRTRNAAPRVVAKGVDEVAERIRAVAKDNNVPLVANPPLARALYLVPIDADIPAEHYQAVAGIIAYVWRLNRRVRGAA